MQFVLNRGVKFLCGLGSRIVIKTGRIDVGHFLIKSSFRIPDVTNARNQFSKIIIADVFACLQAFIIHDEAFSEELFELIRRPLTELCASLASNTIADS